MRCAIWYHLYNLINVKNTHGGLLILVKLQAKACSVTKINTLPWVFFTFLKLYKCYEIAQRITYKGLFITMTKFVLSCFLLIITAFSRVGFVIGRQVGIAVGREGGTKVRKTTYLQCRTKHLEQSKGIKETWTRQEKN